MHRSVFCRIAHCIAYGGNLTRTTLELTHCKCIDALCLCESGHHGLDPRCAQFRLAHCGKIFWRGLDLLFFLFSDLYLLFLNKVFLRQIHCSLRNPCGLWFT